MPSERDKEWLLDITGAIDHIAEFVSGIELDKFQGDRKTRYAVLYGLLVISEASRRLSEGLKGRHPDIPWKDIADAGNIFRHEYQSINERIIWKTVKESLPKINEAISSELTVSKI